MMCTVVIRDSKTTIVPNLMFEWSTFDSAWNTLNKFTARHRKLTFNLFVFLSCSFLFLLFSFHFHLPNCSSHWSIRPTPPQTKTPLCASDTEQWEHLLHQGPVPGTPCGLHHLAGHLLPGEEVCQQCCRGAERQERHWGHSQTYPGEHAGTILLNSHTIVKVFLQQNPWAQESMERRKEKIFKPIYN